MFCRHCGKELSDEALMCPNCGTPTGTKPHRVEKLRSEEAGPPETSSRFAIAVFVFTCILFIVGIIVLSLLSHEIALLDNEEEEGYAGVLAFSSIHILLISMLFLPSFVALFLNLHAALSEKTTGLYRIFAIIGTILSFILIIFIAVLISVLISGFYDICAKILLR